ncbi:MAG TPA: response regulator [Pyrinomonadaceae bacterium]
MNTAPTSSTQATMKPARRRALIIADASAASLQEQLADSGYEAEAATIETAQAVIADFAPDVVIIELPRGTAGLENDRIALARRLRAEPATYGLSLVFVFSQDERALRNTALNIGVDDYFGLWTPHEQILARLDSLFWRIEAGRRSASAVGDQRLEIDNFMLMLDSVSEDIRSGARGTLALVYAAAREGGAAMDKAARDRVLAEAQGFLKLHLRRIDAAAFYGPTTLLVYLPRMNSDVASDVFSRLRSEFNEKNADNDIAVGLASFPSDGGDVETLIEKAEAAASLARSGRTRVVSFKAKERVEVPTPETAKAPLREIPEAARPTAAAPTPPPPRQSPLPGSSTTTTIAQPRPIAPEPLPLSEPPAPVSKPPARAWTLESTVVREKRIDDVVETVAATPVKSGGTGSNGADAARAASEAAARERERRASGAIMPRRLLLTISDAARMAQINSLIRSAGYEARAAFDGQQALDLLRIERPDLLLLDYDLHGIDGLETLRRLRKQNGGRLTMPVVLLMSPEKATERAQALELGARSVVTMPYDPSDLLTSVRMAGSVE